MKKNLFLLALLTAPLFSAQPNPLPGVGLQSAEYFESYDQQAPSAAQKPDLILHNDPTFFTGKHYDQDLGAYVFKYRNYSPDSNRWTSADPSGFPDGPNNYAYAPVPTTEYDYQGLLSQSFNFSYSSGVLNINVTGNWIYEKGSARVSVTSATGRLSTGASVGGVGFSDTLSYTTSNNSTFGPNGEYNVALGLNIVDTAVNGIITTVNVVQINTFNYTFE